MSDTDRCARCGGDCPFIPGCKVCGGCESIPCAVHYPQPGAPEPERDCDICAGPGEECGCYQEDGYCSSCGGTGWCIPYHCCQCGGGESSCICCSRCGSQNYGKCSCPATVKTHDGGTLEVS